MSEREREEIQGVIDRGSQTDPSEGTGNSAGGELPGGGTTKSVDPPTRPPEDATTEAGPTG